MSFTLLSLLSSLGFFFLFYLVASEYAPRYAIIILPLVYLYTLIAFYWYLNRVKPHWSKLLLSIYILIVCGAFSYSWRPKVANLDSYDFRPPSDLRFQDMSRIFREAIGFVTATFPNTPVFGSFPESLYLTDPSAGFVTHPVVFSECIRFDPQVTSTVIFFVHPFSPGQLACKRWVDNLNLKPVKSFSSADKWLELYQYTATPSSKISGQTI